MKIDQLKRNIQYKYVIQDKLNKFYINQYSLSLLNNALIFETKELALDFIKNNSWLHTSRYEIVPIEV